MKNTISSFIKEFIKVVIIVAVAVPTIALFAAWTGPTGVPPTNNADAPVNVGNNSQEKKGDLSIHRAEGGFDVGLFTTDILSVLGGAIFNKNEPDDKKVIIKADGNVGIGITAPQSPAPNNLSGNIDANDVYLRSTGQWVSEISGGGSIGLPDGYEFAVFPLEVRIFKVGTRAHAVCKTFVDKDKDFHGEAKHDSDGKVRTRAWIAGTYVPSLVCDSGWVVGVSASCSVTESDGSPTLTAKAKTSYDGLSLEGGWNWNAMIGWRCFDEAIWQ